MFERNKHDYLVDNVNSKSHVNSDHEVRSTQMCSYQQDESTENCSFQQCIVHMETVLSMIKKK